MKGTKKHSKTTIGHFDIKIMEQIWRALKGTPYLSALIDNCKYFEQQGKGGTWKVLQDCPCESSYRVSK